LSAKQEIRQAPFRMVILDNYDLSNLDLEFRLADFEREPVQSHWMKIVFAIRNGTLFDNVITVMDRKDEGGAYIVIDGQHRYMALKYLYEEGELDTYSIVLRVLHTVAARDAYRLLNAGRPLVSDDILKSYDDGSVLTFNKFRPYCVFFMTHPNKLSYSLVIKTMGYATSASVSGGGGDRERLVKLALNAKPGDVDIMVELLELILCKNMLHSKHMIVKVAPFWMLARYYWKNRHPNITPRFSKFIDAVVADEECRMLSRQGRNALVLQEMDRRMQELWKLV
jgi:hypothetical protein